MKGIHLQRWLKVAISIVIFGVLYYQLFENEDVRQLWHSFLANQQTFRYGLLIVAGGMVFINWGVETYKWQVLLKGIQSLAFGKAFTAVLAGVALATITPGRIGEYGGRIWFLNKNVRLKGIIVTMVGSLGQMLATILMGVLGVIYWLYAFEPARIDYPYLLTLLLLVVGVLSVVAYYRLKWVAQVAERIPWLRKNKKILQAIRIFGFYGREKLNFLLLISLLRFVVYATQYVLVLWAFNVWLPFHTGLLLVSGIFFGQLLLPVPALAELGVRGNLALFFFGMLSVNELTVVSASITLWLINLIIPAVIGAFLFMLRKQEEL